VRVTRGADRATVWDFSDQPLLGCNHA